MAAAQHGDEGMTTGEIRDALGVSETRARDALRRLIRGGVMVATRVRRPALDGRLALVPAYRLVR